jgi:small redox-active disulfide protein 2
VVDVRQIMVGGVKVGLVDLDSILERVRTESLESDEAIAERLLELARQVNYITPSRAEEYRKALLREFKRSRGDDIPPEPGSLEIRVLGPGCPNCDRLMSEVRTALAELEIDADLEHVHDLKAIAGFGPVGTPALVINGKVVASGRVPKGADLTHMLREAKQ